MKRLLLLLSVCVFSYGLVWAQAQTFTGRVLNDADGEPVIGASIQVKGTSRGTISDVDGKFTISAERGETLVVSFIGMESQEVEAARNLVVRLVENTQEIDEVMVVAFGTTTKKSFTGSASVVKADEIVKRQTSNVTDALAGAVAGVQGLSTSGQPGTVSNIRIRGIGSINADMSPLYVIDGVPANDDAISTLSNADIESVTVLKDAASSALYGARGANGVILITTKRGSTRDAQVNVDAKWGTNRRQIPKYDVMTDPGMYYETYYQALAYSGKYGDNNQMNQYMLNQLGYQVYSIPGGEQLIGTNGKLNPNATLGYVNKNGYTLLADDWYDELFKSNNLRQEYNISVSGSTDKLTYFTSASYLDDTGIIENSGFKRVTTRLNVDYQAKKWLKIGTNMSYSHADMKYPSEDENGNPSSANLFYVSNLIAPIYPLYVRDGEGNILIDDNGFTVYDYGDGMVGSTRAFMPMANPASAIQLDKEIYKKDIFTGKWFVQVEPVKGLKATANVGLHYGGVRHQETINPYYGEYATSGGSVSVRATRSLTIDQQYLLTYARKFGDHNVDALVGYENYKYIYSRLSGFKQKMFNPDIAELGNAILSPSADSYTNNYFTQGILLQAKYDYASRYFFSASYRRDASSRFAKGHQWGNFWSVGAAWDINAEKFMEGIEQIDLLKLKVSYGSQGNDALGGYYVWADQYVLTENNGDFAKNLTYKGNEDLTWETSYNFNAGIDFAFFNERLSGTIEGWRRRTVDMLYFQPVPASNGFNEIPINVGSVSNAGIDIELRGDVFRTKNVTWTLFANLSHFKNKILELAPELNGELIDGTYILKEGKSRYNRYLKHYVGVNSENGKSLWATDDIEKYPTGVTENWSDATTYEYGDILPKVYGGFGTTLEAYGVDFSMQFAYQLGGEIYDNTYRSLMHGGNSSYIGDNWHTDILKAWTPENPNTDVPAVDASESYVNGLSDRWMVSSNYLSLQNITLGYTLPRDLTRKAKLEKVRVYAVADNVALWTKRKGLDPRQGFGGTSSAYYAPIRSISGGISITF